MVLRELCTATKLTMFQFNIVYNIAQGRWSSSVCVDRHDKSNVKEGDPGLVIQSQKKPMASHQPGKPHASSS